MAASTLFHSNTEFEIRKRSLDDVLADLTSKLRSDFNSWQVLMNPNRLWFNRRAIMMSESRKRSLLDDLQDLLVTVINQIKNKCADELSFLDRSSWLNCKFHVVDGICLRSDARERVRPAMKRLCRLVILIDRVLTLISTNTFKTKRELYYMDCQIYECQTSLDHLIDDLAFTYRLSRLELHVLAVSKGVAYGDLTVEYENETKDFSRTIGGTSIPDDFLSIKQIRSTAKFVLVVEKDSTFQDIIRNSQIVTDLECIVVTGKGYPDTTTRQFVRLLFEYLQIPLFALVDADPHGIEIMCVYRFGSLSMSHDHYNLVTPQIKWLGVRPSDFLKYAKIKPSSFIALDDHDRQKISELLNRPYVRSNDMLRTELQYMQYRNVKLEMQALNELGHQYLQNQYIQRQITEQNFL